MTETIIHIDGSLPIHELDTHGWVQGTWEDADHHICAHQAIRLCAPVKGDAYLIEQVAKRQGWGPEWNDDDETTEQMVRERLSAGIDITDADLKETYGPQWRAVVSLVRRAAVLTDDEAERLRAAGAARAAAWDAAGAARAAAWDAAGDAAWDAAGDARAAAWDAALAIVTYDLATPDGPYTIAQRDLLLAPWVSVCGEVDGLLETGGME